MAEIHDFERHDGVYILTTDTFESFIKEAVARDFVQLFSFINRTHLTPDKEPKTVLRITFIFA